MGIKSFEDLEIWKIARENCKSVWKICQYSSLKEDFGLKNQMIRSSGSVMDNIAEGFERNGNKEFIQFLSIAKSSNGELRSQLYRCLDREHINSVDFEALIQKINLNSRKIQTFITYLKTSNRTGFKFN